MDKRVIAIILNYKRPVDTTECVLSLKRSTYRSLQILVLDNDSGDDVESRIKEVAPDVETLQTGRNLGFAGGNNVGIRFAMEQNPEYILLLNNDTLVEPDFLNELVVALEADENAAAATGIICYFPEKERIWYAGGDFIPWRVGSFTRGVGEKYESPKHRTADSVTFISGCMMLIRTSALRNVGLFDERFFMYHEDAELSMRLVSAGYRLLYVPTSRIYHKAIHLGDNPFQLYYSVRNRLLLAKGTTTGVERFLGQAYFLAALSIKMLLWIFTRPDLFKGAWLGLVDYRRNVFYEGRGLSLI